MGSAISGEDSGEKAPPSYFVGRKEDVIKAKQVSTFMNGRDVLVIYHEGKFYAMDTHCYHTGSSLENGDIEEIDSKLCIVCPAHKRIITLAEGEELYDRNPKEEMLPPCWLSKGVKQRLHAVVEADGAVYVRMSEERGWIESDYYQSEKQRQRRREREERKSRGEQVEEEEEDEVWGR